MATPEPSGKRIEANEALNTSGLDLSPRRLAEEWSSLVNASPLRFTFSLVLALQLLVLVAFRPSYGTNDDVFMTMVASGKGIGVAPDAHLVFTNILIGSALKHLYTWFSTIPWYGGYLLFTHLVSQVALLYCALSVGRRVDDGPLSQRLRGRLAPVSSWELGLRLGTWLLYYLLVELPLLNRLQFTSTAFLAGTAGLFLILTAWRRRTLQPTAPVAALLVSGAALLVAAGLIRIESLALAGLISVPVAIAIVSKFSRTAMMPCGTAVVVAVMLVAVAAAFDQWCYESDPQWAGFRSLNQLRGKFHDEKWTAYTPETARLFSDAGWSENDHAMISRWFSDQPAVYTPAKMTSIVEGHPWQTQRQSMERWTTTYRDIARNRAVLSVLLALPLMAIAIQGGPRARGALVGTILGAIVLIAVVTYMKKSPPFRVYFPLMSFPLATLLLGLGWRRAATADTSARCSWALVSSLWSLPAWRRQSLLSRLTVVLMAVALVMGVYSQVRRSKHVIKDRALLAEFLDSIAADNRTLYVSWEAALPYELVSPLDNLSAWPQASFLSLAWTQQTAWHEAVKRRFAISDLAQALCSRDDLQLIARPAHRELFVRFAKEHFSADVEFVPQRELGRKFSVGQFRIRTSPIQMASPAVEAQHR